MKQNKITPRNQMIIMKVRQRFPNKDLAYRFDISISSFIHNKHLDSVPV